jgi:hypothetical protein
MLLPFQKFLARSDLNRRSRAARQGQIDIPLKHSSAKAAPQKSMYAAEVD